VKIRKIAGLTAMLMGAASIMTFAPSAHAATASNVVTFQLTGAAALTIGVSANPGSVSGSVAAGTTINSPLGATTITDNTGSLLGWTVTADATALSDGATPTPHTIPKTSMVWATGAITPGPTGSATGVSLGVGGAFGVAPVAVAKALATNGGGSYSYPATVTLTVPVNSYAATYTSTITQTVA
jgi:hypothetical protein